MSAFWNRRRMVRAVAGELSGSEELALQKHLTHCRGCREHYERLTVTARALGGTGDATVDEDRRVLARLNAFLSSSTTEPPRPSTPRRKAMVFSLVPLMTAIAAVVVFAWSAGPPSSIVDREQMEWRGSSTGGSDTGPEVLPLARLWMYAHTPQRGIRLVAELPASGEGVLHRSESIQLSYQGTGSPRFLSVVALDARGETYVYFPQGEGDPKPLPALPEATSLGRSIRLEGHALGVLRLYAFLTDALVSEQDLRLAAKSSGRLTGQRAYVVLSGVFQVQP
jgi:hypothetical protein